MSPEAISRRLRKSFDLGMLNRHLLSKLVRVAPDDTCDSASRIEGKQSKMDTTKQTHAPH